MNQESFNKIINTFKTTMNKQDTPLNMHYLSIQQDNQVNTHAFNDRTEPSDIRSISKTVMTIITGVVIDFSKKGIYTEFNEETYIYPIIKDKIKLTNISNLDKLKQIKVKHLLNHTMGYDKVLMMRGDIKDMNPFTYLDYIINEPIEYEPGKHYLYSNAGFYLLSVVLQEFIQEDLLTFINQNLFNPLNIDNFKWEKYGNYLAGATRLFLLPEDLLKIGHVIMSKGMFQNKRIVSHQWVDTMLTPTTKTPQNDTPENIFRRYAYASGIWLAKEPIYFGHGTDGQTLVMIPEKNAIIVTLAHEQDIKEIENVINTIITQNL